SIQVAMPSATPPISRWQPPYVVGAVVPSTALPAGTGATFSEAQGGHQASGARDPQLKPFTAAANHRCTRCKPDGSHRGQFTPTMLQNISLLDDISRRCASGDALDRDQARWLGDALRRFLSRQSPTFEDAFGLQPVRGGVSWRHELAIRRRNAAL